MVAPDMNDHVDEKPFRGRRLSIVPSTSVIPEETVENPTISNLVVTNPIADPDAVSDTLRPLAADSRSRRRSSTWIMPIIAKSQLDIPIKDVRKKSKLVGSSLLAHENEANDLHACFPNGRAVTVMVATWNTAETKKLYELNYTPTARLAAQFREEMHENLADILLPTCLDYVGDVIVVNTQETAPAKESMDWEILLQEVIGPTHVLLHSSHFGSLSLCVLIRRDLIWFCSKPEEDVIRFRMIDPVRTKASLVVCFNMFGTSFMFINSHFQDGHNAEGRLNRELNFRHTINHCKIPHEYIKRKGLYVQTDVPMKEKLEELKSTDSAPVGDEVPHKPGIDPTKACDYVFWAGDFNFRVSMDRKDILDRIQHSKFSEILQKDEFHLLLEQKKEPYANFKEAKIAFAPTYKFDRKADSDADQYIANRVPAYTDRILYREKSGSSIECTKYVSVDTVKHSDHKPVLAHFRIKLKPGSPGNHGYGRFNQDVYRYGCQQREKHLSMGIGVSENTHKSSLCTIV